MSMNEYDNEKEKDMTENATAGENAAVNENTAAVAPRAGKSRGGRISRIILAAVILVFIVWFGFTFRLREGSCAIVLRFGAPRSLHLFLRQELRLVHNNTVILRRFLQRQFLDKNTFRL